MSDIEIKMFPASYGDSFLITCKANKKTHILVDMGFKSTYNKFIKKELEKLSETERLSLLVFSHIDEDHILGGISFFEENGYSKNTNIIEIDEIWFNSYRHLKSQKNIIIEDEEQLSKIDNFLKNIIKKGHARERGEPDLSNISAAQGITLASLLYKNGYLDSWNKAYCHQAVRVHKDDKGKLKSVCINDEVKLIVLSPTQNDLEDLEKKWLDELKKMDPDDRSANKLMEDAFEMYLATLQEYEQKRRISKIASIEDNIEDIADAPFVCDVSVVNRSSIAFVLEFYDKKLLFLADANPLTIEASLNEYLTMNQRHKQFFNAIKISHHGSKYNTSKSLLNKIESDKYIISTNSRGRHKHPDIETIFRIITSKTEYKKKLIFNYLPSNIFRRINDDHLKKKYNYEIEYTNNLSETNKVETTLIKIRDDLKVENG